MNLSLTDFVQYCFALAFGFGPPLVTLLWGPVLIEEQFLPEIAYVGSAIGGLAAVAASVCADIRESQNKTVGAYIIYLAVACTLLIMLCFWYRQLLLNISVSEWLLRLAPFIWQFSFVMVWATGGAFFGLVFVALKRLLIGQRTDKPVNVGRKRHL